MTLEERNAHDGSILIETEPDAFMIKQNFPDGADFKSVSKHVVSYYLGPPFHEMVFHIGTSFELYGETTYALSEEDLRLSDDVEKWLPEKTAKPDEK